MNRRGSSVMDCVSTWSAREFRASEAKKHHEASQSEQHLPTALRQKATGDLVPPCKAGAHLSSAQGAHVPLTVPKSEFSQHPTSQ